MEERRAVRVSRVLLPVVAALVLSACRQPVTGTPGTPAGSPRVGTAATGHGPEFLGPAECGSRGEAVREVSCGSEKAAARVLARHSGTPSDGPACPPTTDFVLNISRGGPSAPRGYACMRNLESPHPGDPGQGGGPRTVVGDCVHGFRDGEVRETACDGSGERPPEFEIGSAVARRALCPDTTDLYVRLGGDRPVGCAHRV
ncbi:MULTISPECIES: hypothetical protein [Streptomyces]|uniref:Lipoprotein n=1 Tax=Streptomyces glycanivorans TaxID=3033808 RepID=A0ABY9JF57_9ACTN|nr:MULTISPECIES: hypothetical protein [unclassified Streptomyces]WSQ79794.1 hypothetical protein OG725_23045 [Streptomyces sp. NBC_01213]TXS09044.1 hypothetical protein EAO68_33875 [Streptomyces sp. wa22]WLQ66345.1 hypothetical protein P8A20_23450 [Streptomyces sp. Alt3]WSQ87173.1 hypothetical protein OG722_23725 [Streptomyces sp. NBC_01212]WSR06811.1 hypothetical protein OG265_12695 [Streptomyces sp. NBC_01208]